MFLQIDLFSHFPRSDESTLWENISNKKITSTNDKLSLNWQINHRIYSQTIWGSDMILYLSNKYHKMPNQATKVCFELAYALITASLPRLYGGGECCVYLANFIRCQIRPHKCVCPSIGEWLITLFLPILFGGEGMVVFTWPITRYDKSGHIPNEHFQNALSSWLNLLIGWLILLAKL